MIIVLENVKIMDRPYDSYDDKSCYAYNKGIKLCLMNYLCVRIMNINFP
jgi:hypothetical protein